MRERDGQTDRQTDRETETERDTERDRETEREKYNTEIVSIEKSLCTSIFLLIFSYKSSFRFSDWISQSPLPIQMHFLLPSPHTHIYTLFPLYSRFSDSLLLFVWLSIINHQCNQFFQSSYTPRDQNPCHVPINNLIMHTGTKKMMNVFIKVMYIIIIMCPTSHLVSLSEKYSW